MEKQETITEQKSKNLIPTLDLDTKKEIAKIGMTATMGITVATSMYMKNKFMKRLHVVAGVALVGFSYWHHILYQPTKKKENVKDLTVNKNLKKSEEILEEKENIAISLNSFFAEMSINGKLTHGEFKAFEQKIESLLSSYEVPSMNILIDITKLEGLDFKVLWDDILFTIKHIKEMKKVAIVGNSKAEEYSTSFANRVFPFELEYFEEYNKAKDWLKA